MKRITVTDKTWKKLQDLKVENKCKNLDEVIRLLIEPGRKCKPEGKIKWNDMKKKYGIT